MVLYGGAAGSLKSTALLKDAIRYYQHPRARSILFRQTYTELKNLIERCQQMMPEYGAYQREGGKEWVFPSGARFYLAGCQYDADITKWKGPEFDWIGWDEVTEANEAPLRFIISRNRSADPFLQENLRVRLATNPGGPGHHWVKHIFIGEGCHHCEPTGNTRQPFKIYSDAKWQSDGRTLDVEGRGLFTTCFIPGHLSDHDLLPNYDSLLRMMPAWQEKAYREGCWKVTRGQYFDCFSKEKNVVVRQSIGDEWWWPHWLAADYGFSGSAAAAGLFTQTPARTGKPNGVTIKLEEYVSRMETAYDFGKTIWNNWGFVGGRQRRLIAAYLSPDSFNNRGDDPGTALSDQMEDGAADAHGRLGFEPASNDRVAGWNLMYQMFRNEDLFISDACTKTIAAISSRIRDPRNGNDILKKAGDELDDVADECFVAGTMVSTPSGLVPIENICAGDLVITRKGPKRVVRAGSTGCRQTWLLQTSSGAVLQGTGNHPVFVKGTGFRALDTLRYGDNLVTCHREHLPRLKPLSSMESLSEDIQTQNRGPIGCTSVRAELTARRALGTSTKKYGSQSTVPSLKVITSTILTKTQPTTIRRTCKPSQEGSISPITCVTGRSGRSNSPISKESGHSRLRGINQRKAGDGIVNTLPVLSGKSLPGRANIAEVVMRLPQDAGGSVQTPVSRRGGERSASIQCRRPASFVAKSISGISLRKGSSAQSLVLSVRTGPVAEVFNLTVEGCPEYFANGILVHNCRYGIFSHNRPAAKPDELVMQELAQSLVAQGAPAHERAMQMRAAQAKIDAGKVKTYHYLSGY